MLTPKWLTALERRIGWIAIPNLSVILITLQALGFLFVMMEPMWITRLALFPASVLGGEVWRLVTFLALPLTMSPFWLIFVLWFLYFIVETLEANWGAFKTTFYVLISVALTIAYSLIVGYPVMSVSHLQSTLFLAAASLFPEMEVRLFLAIPVKMKWLAWLSGAFVLVEAWRGDWADRGYLIAMYSNFLVFFGPAALESIRLAIRRRNYRRKLR